MDEDQIIYFVISLIWLCFLLWLSGYKNAIAKKRFTTRYSRIGAVILFAGGFVLTACYWPYIGSHYAPTEWLTHVFDRGYSYMHYSLTAKISIFIMLYGFITAYFYDATLGKLKDWINGK